MPSRGVYDTFVKVVSRAQMRGVSLVIDAARPVARLRDQLDRVVDRLVHRQIAGQPRAESVYLAGRPRPVVVA